MYYSNFSLLIAILSLMLFSLASCSKEVTLDTGEEVVVVECILSCDSIQHLNLAYTHPKSQKAGTQVISEAQVTLFDETTNTSAGAFQFFNNSWTLSYSAIPLQTYRLDIDVPGHDHIFARQTMPDQVRIWSFLWSMWSNQAGVPISDFDYNISGELFEPIAMQIDTCGKTLSYTICEGLEGQPLHKKYMRTNLSQADRGDYDGYTFIVCGSFFDQNNPKPDEPLGSKGGILFVTTSEDYDRYLQESIYYQQQQESTDMSSIYLRDNVFSNIKGGIGIFGAKTQCLEKWIMKDSSFLQAGLK